MQEEKAIEIKNKLHLLTFFIATCEEEEPLEEEENAWHDEFEQVISSILYINENGYIEEEKMHELNDLYTKWSERFERLGLDEVPVEKWQEGEDPLEDEIAELLEAHLEEKS